MVVVVFINQWRNNAAILYNIRDESYAIPVFDWLKPGIILH